jgi:hypothetical protein
VLEGAQITEENILRHSMGDFPETASTKRIEGI